MTARLRLQLQRGAIGVNQYKSRMRVILRLFMSISKDCTPSGTKYDCMLWKSGKSGKGGLMGKK